MKTIFTLFSMLVVLVCCGSFSGPDFTNSVPLSSLSKYGGTPFDHVKSWNVLVTLSSDYSVTEVGDWKHSIKISAKANGFITDESNPAGYHYGWPTPDIMVATSSLNYDVFADLISESTYLETETMPGTGASADPINRQCTGSGKLTSGLSILPGTSKYGGQIVFDHLVAPCSGNGTIEPGSSVVTIDFDGPLPAALQAIEGSKTVTIEDHTYSVSWSFTPKIVD